MSDPTFPPADVYPPHMTGGAPLDPFAVGDPLEFAKHERATEAAPRTKRKTRKSAR